MKINVFGLGYVGCVTAACLAEFGNSVTGLDIDKNKVDIINSRMSPIIEDGLGELIDSVVSKKSLRAAFDEIPDAEVSIVCVGTPSNSNGSLRLDYVKRVSEQIGNFLRSYDGYHVVNIRSTILPGTVEEIIIPILEENSLKKAGVHFGVCMNPEFMREGTSIYDFYNPPFTVIGAIDEKSATVIDKLYTKVKAPSFITEIKVAEMVKYACNSFHALKVTFANEIGNICKAMSIDSHSVMDIFCSDVKLNISKYYLKPGFAFGGSCLPKDLKAILYKAKMLDVESMLLSAILPSNRNQIQAAFNMIKETGKRKIGMLGLSFKEGTDDLRESPNVELVEMLIGKGYEVSIFDKEVNLARLFGSNKEYIENVIPHISTVMKDNLEEVVNSSDVIVIGKNGNEFKNYVTKTKNKTIIDLVRITSENLDGRAHYEGLCW